MSKYTTEVRFICETAIGLSDSKGYTDVNSIIAQALPSIFDFEFPIFDENYRGVLERKIIKHFYTREIGEETVGLWKLRLDTKLNEIMPYYNKMYESELIKINPLSTHESTTTRNISGEKTGNNSNKIDTTFKGNTDNTTINNSTDKYSDTPQGALTGLLRDSYLTNARVVDDTNDFNSKTNNTNNSTATGNYKDGSLENYLEKVSGYNGITASELIVKYRASFINIDMLIIDELEELFINLW